MNFTRLQEVVVVENDEPPPLHVIPFPSPSRNTTSDIDPIDPSSLPDFPDASLSDPPPSPLLPGPASGSLRRELSPMHQFRKRFYPGIDARTWNDWKWQYARRIRTLSELRRFIALDDHELAAWGEGTTDVPNLPFSITPYYLSLLDPGNSAQPLRRTMIPSASELILSPGEEADPLHEYGDSPVPAIVHRYPDRVLFLVTSSCAAYCRYCTRSRFAGGHTTPMRAHWDQAVAYIREHREVRDVIVSGGDPLTLVDEGLEYLLTALYAIPHVEMVRLGTKMPIVLPYRVTPGLTRMLKRFKPLYMSIHATHPDELTPEAVRALNRLADAGVVLGSQTVLLRGINDASQTLRELFHRLLRCRVRPYYLYQCDPVAGSAHFRTTLAEGLQIMRELRGYTSGYAIPHYIVDTPGGGGKVPVLPDYSAGRDADNLYFRNYAGDIYAYPERTLSAVCSQEAVDRGGEAITC